MLSLDALQPKMNNFLEEGDIDEALSAHAVGDDTRLKRSRILHTELRRNVKRGL
jgi:predicted metalloprotease